MSTLDFVCRRCPRHLRRCKESDASILVGEGQVPTGEDLLRKFPRLCKVVQTFEGRRWLRQGE